MPDTLENRTSPATCGPFAVTFGEGGIRSVTWHGTEVLRGITAPVRDIDWGVIPEVTARETLDEIGTGLRYSRVSHLPNDMGEARFVVDILPSGSLDIAWTLTASAPLTVNRAGFCVLHPLSGIEGAELRVTRPDGTSWDTAFPTRITPAQPAKDIAALSYRGHGIDIDIQFEGETFEMEDQRNWSDASFKTYCRPLDFPRPFAISSGQSVSQRIAVTVAGAPTSGGTVDQDRRLVTMPEILLAVEPDWIGDIPVGCAALARFDEQPWDDTELGFLRHTPFDAEIVVPDGVDPARHLADWSLRFGLAGLSPRHVIALPAAYLKSHQPQGPWPDGYTPKDCARAAGAAFPNSRIGLGMLTNFTEFNRCPPSAELGQFVTHGNSAIVHAADDLSVMQTIEALPAVFGSARALGGDRPYRLGLVSIGMRTNPYGDGLHPNPEGEKRTMTAMDPRQGTDFAAAYAIASTALAALLGAEAICLAAPAGPFAATGPLRKAVTGLAAITGQRATITTTAGQITIAAGNLTLCSNVGMDLWPDAPGGPLGPMAWRHMEGAV